MFARHQYPYHENIQKNMAISKTLQIFVISPKKSEIYNLNLFNCLQTPQITTPRLISF